MRENIDHALKISLLISVASGAHQRGVITLISGKRIHIDGPVATEILNKLPSNSV